MEKIVFENKSLSTTEKEIKLEDFPQQYMENYWPETYSRVKKSICRFNNSELAAKLNEFYLKRNKKCHYERYSTKELSIEICKYLNEINHSDIEFYLEYCLEYFEEEFLPFLYIISEICMKTNFALQEICDNHLKFSSLKEKNNLLENIFTTVSELKKENPILIQSLEEIKEIEKMHMLACYELAKDGKTFCDNCVPICWVKKKGSVQSRPKYKRTTPYRY